LQNKEEEMVLEKNNPVQSIQRSANILDCVSNGIGTITEISDYCKLSKSTVHRLLRGLVESQIIVQDPIEHKYYLGYLITRLLNRPKVTNEYLIRCSNDEMRRLSDYTGETVFLGVMQALKYVGLHENPSRKSLRVIVQSEDMKVGPVFAGAGGKVLLSQLSQKEVELALKHTTMESYTNHTVTDKEEFLAQIRRIRQQGYAVSYNEIVMGVTCISAPIKNYDIPVVLSIIGPQDRVNPEFENYLKALLVSTDKISDRIAEFAGEMSVK
jgi:DNA-binding IclR family transcriptional regulator